jgi:hypothetical protein
MTDTIQLDRLAHASTSPDGRSVRFAVHGADGQSVEVACDHGDIEKLIHFLVQLGQRSAERRSQVTPHFFGHSDNITVSPMDVSDVGLMRGMESDEIVLVARMSGFDLGFSVSAAQLGALHKEIERVVPRAMLHADDHHHHGDDHHHGHGHHRHDHGHRR